MTMFKGIYKLPPGCWLRIGPDGDTRMHPLLRRGAGQGHRSVARSRGLSDAALEDFYVDGIRTRLHAAVERRMMSDVPFGVFLSGGIDSSTNVALMSRFSDQPVDTFTVGFKDFTSTSTSSSYADIVAKHFNTKHHEVLIDEGDMIGYLDSLIHHQDEPIADWVCIPLYFVSKLARDNGVTGRAGRRGLGRAVLRLCKSYMGYLRLYHRYWQPFRSYVPQPLSEDGGHGRDRRFGHRSPPCRSMPTSSIARRATASISGRRHVFWNTSKDRLVRYDALGERRPSRADDPRRRARPELSQAGQLQRDQLVPGTPFDKAHPGQDALTRMIYNEFRLRLPELLLMRVDKITMSVSLEARVPFLDHELVDFTMDIPEAWKTKQRRRQVSAQEGGRRPHPGRAHLPQEDGLRRADGRLAARRLRRARRARNHGISQLLQRGFFNIGYIDRTVCSITAASAPTPACRSGRSTI